MISAREKREQMSVSYWSDIMHKKVASALEHIDADKGSVQVDFSVPPRFKQEIWRALKKELINLGYETRVQENPPDKFEDQIFIKWSK